MIHFKRIKYKKFISWSNSDLAAVFVMNNDNSYVFKYKHQQELKFNISVRIPDMKGISTVHFCKK